MEQVNLKIIDPHLHFFNLQQGDYHWLQPHQAPFWEDKHLLRKNFSQTDLSLDSTIKLAGFVHIEAGFDNHQPWREIDWLEKHCFGAFKTVAYADITSTAFAGQLKQLKQRQSVAGIRYILDEQGAAILNAALTQKHFALLAQHNFSFDAQFSLLNNQASEALVAMAKQFNEVPIIINHAGFAPKQDPQQKRQIWQKNLKKLADCKNIAIKLSGWEMTDRGWHPEHANSVLEDCIGVLGENRVMLASNFPLCLLRKSYRELWQIYQALSTFSPKTREKITYHNAKKWYNF